MVCGAGPGAVGGRERGGVRRKLYAAAWEDLRDALGRLVWMARKDVGRGVCRLVGHRWGEWRREVPLWFERGPSRSRFCPRCASTEFDQGEFRPVTPKFVWRDEG